MIAGQTLQASGELLYERSNISDAQPVLNAWTYLVLHLTEIGEFADGLKYGDEALRLAEATHCH